MWQTSIILTEANHMEQKQTYTRFDITITIGGIVYIELSAVYRWYFIIVRAPGEGGYRSCAATPANAPHSTIYICPVKIITYTIFEL